MTAVYVPSIRQATRCGWANGWAVFAPTGGKLITVMNRHLLAGVLACALLTSCHGSRKKVIAVIPKGTSHLFWQTVQAGAIAAGRDLGVEVLWNGPSQETEYSRQIQIVDSMVARHVDGLAVAATDKTALSQPIERAAKAGLQVTVFDSGVDTKEYL